MSKKKYKVLYNDTVVAENMDMNTATILLRALFEEYFADYGMTISVREMERTEAVCCDTFESRVGTLSICNANLEENYRRACAQRDARKPKAEEKLHPYKLHYGNLKIEIVHEFADRLKTLADAIFSYEDNYSDPCNSVKRGIDNLVKEMTEE